MALPRSFKFKILLWEGNTYFLIEVKQYLEYIKLTVVNLKEGYLKSFIFNELFKSVYNVKMPFLVIVACVTTVEPPIRGYTLSCSFCVIQIAYQWNKT